MPKIDRFLQIQVAGGREGSSIVHEHVGRLIAELLHSEEWFQSLDGPSDQRFLNHFENRLPQIQAKPLQERSDQLSVLMIAPYRPHSEHFFYEMVGRWLLPQRSYKVALYFKANFNLINLEGEFAVVEMTLQFNSGEECNEACHRLLMMRRELILGLTSFYHAARILEVNGAPKIFLIQNYIAHLIRKHPGRFDEDLFDEMHHILYSCSRNFKQSRDAFSMTLLICLLYLAERQLAKKVQSTRREWIVKMRPTYIHLPFGFKKVLGALVGMSMMKRHELFQKRHLIDALHHISPNLLLVEDSFYLYERDEVSALHLMYFEIEKSDGLSWTLEEIQLLKRRLPEEMQVRVEQLVSPLFKPRNGEEVMRSILALADQIVYSKDLPHLMISFDEHSDQHISFLVVLVRIQKEGGSALVNLLEEGLRSEHVVERIKLMGRVEKKSVKEAAVLRVLLPNQHFFREDYSLDLRRARQAVLEEMRSVLGEVRDFNGGMIAKQQEMFERVRIHLGERAERYPRLLEEFYFSIFPVESSTTLDAAIYAKLFEKILSLIEEDGEGSKIATDRDPHYCLVALRFQDSSSRPHLNRLLKPFHFGTKELIYAEVRFLNHDYLGLILTSSEPKTATLLLNLLQTIHNR